MRRSLLLVLGLILCRLASAGTVVSSLPGGLQARAEYQAGKAGMPAVFLLHGFLQTHEFPTIARLASGLQDEGYTVLAPTLTLGITHRRQSMACEALHQHTLEDDLKEINHWLNWLQKRHPGPVVLVGHSVGSLELLAYVRAGMRPTAQKFIGISIVEGRSRVDRKDVDARIQSLSELIRQGRTQPVKMPFSFCAQYTGTPQGLLSYLEWTPARILQAARPQDPRLVFIMGDRDNRLGPDWIGNLRKTPAKVTVIPGANHFMDGEHEFELLDTVISELNAL